MDKYVKYEAIDLLISEFINILLTYWKQTQTKKLFMIEIRIPTSAAVLLLKEKIVLELKALQKANIIPFQISVDDLSDEELLNITETAAFDLIFSLPAEIYVSESNIADIIYKSIKSFANSQKSTVFSNYTRERAENLVKPIKYLFEVYGEKEVFSKN